MLRAGSLEVRNWSDQPDGMPETGGTGCINKTNT